MARGIQQIILDALILKTKHGRGNRNAPLFFNRHPVGCGIPAGFALADGACLMDSPSIQQEFFRKRRFPGIRM